MSLVCATGNKYKFALAKRACDKFGIKLEQAVIDIDEIQGEDGEKIVSHKAKSAFAQLSRPVVVTDDYWDIPALGGFPGAYMKSMNYWLKPEDFIRLMNGVTGRDVILHEYLAYCDGTETVTFLKDIRGQIMTEPRGKNGATFMKVVSMEGDNGLTLAEVQDAGKQHNLGRVGGDKDAYHAFAEWYSANHS